MEKKGNTHNFSGSYILILGHKFTLQKPIQDYVKRVKLKLNFFSSLLNTKWWILDELKKRKEEKKLFFIYFHTKPIKLK